MYPYKGHESPYSYTGSLLLNVKIENHESIYRKGINTFSDLYISYADAILGKETKV